MKCEYCGKELPTDSSGTVDRRRKFCSDECFKNSRAKYIHDYYMKRYKKDEKYTQSKLAKSREWNQRKREELREQLYTECVESIANCETVEEAIALVKKNYHISRRHK